MSMIDWEAQTQRNLEHADNPVPGDRWNERGNPTCKVIAVGPDYVTIDRIDGRQTMTRSEFSRWLRYETIPHKTWSDCLPEATQ